MDSPLRRLAIPHDHMLAEVAALPIASEESFRNGLVELHPLLSISDPTEANEPTKALWCYAERMLTGSFPSMSLDDLTNLRDWVWFGGGKEATHRPVSLRRYACRVVDIWSGSAQASIGGPEPTGVQARRLNRWFTFALPRGLLDQSGPTPMPPRLERLFDEEGFAEIHLHAGVGMEFGVLWAAAARSVAVAPPKKNEFKAPGAAFGEGAEIAEWLVRAMVARYLLAGYLGEPRGADQLLPWLERNLTRLGAGHFSRLMTVLDDLSVGRMRSGVAYDEVIEIYRLLIGSRGNRKYRERQEVLLGDPVAAFFPGSEGFADERFHKVARGHLKRLERADGQSERDDAFTRLYWQLVRFQAIFYRHVVQRPMTPGLTWFIRTYAHAGAAKKLLSWRFLVREARRTSGEKHGLRSLEVRTAPKDTVAANKELVDAIAELSGVGGERGTDDALGWQFSSLPSTGVGKGGKLDFQGRPPCEIGLVLHFVKDRKGGFRQGCPSAFWEGTLAMPEFGLGDSPTPRYRYAPYYRNERRKALAVGELLLRYPRSLQFLRGLDCCTDEQGVPTWVLAPLFRYLRDASEKARTYLGQEGVEVRPLGLTAHVGEDFVYLTTGLRRIAEALDYFGFGEGDRIGHGMALGIDPKTWARESGPVLVAREDRLFDLAWERTCLLQDDSDGPGNRLSRVEHQLREQVSRMFERSVEPDVIDLFVTYLHEGQRLEEVGFPDNFDRRHRPTPWGGPVELQALKLLDAYLTDPAVFRRGRELIQVDPVPEIEAMQALQSKLRTRIGHLGIPIEVNPSSNLLIGNLARMENHPIFRLSPVRQGSKGVVIDRRGSPSKLPPVSVCVGSDDPLVFACDLPRELVLLHDTLIAADVPPEAAIHWIRDVMRTGRQARFTCPPATEIDDLPVVGLGQGLAPIP